MTIRILNLLTAFPTSVFSLAHFPPLAGLHRPLPSFSTLQSFEFESKELNLGSVADIFLFCLEKKPSFLVVKLGVPLTWLLLAFVAAQAVSFDADPLRSS